MRNPVDKMFTALKAAIVYEGKILLLQESAAYADGTNRGRWELPGGRLQPGEHFADGLRREVKEETGLDITIDRPYMLGEWWPHVRGEQWQIVATFVLCAAKNDQVILGEEHEEYVWIDPREADQFTNYAAYIKEALQSYVELLEEKL